MPLMRMPKEQTNNGPIGSSNQFDSSLLATALFLKNGLRCYFTNKKQVKNKICFLCCTHKCISKFAPKVTAQFLLQSSSSSREAELQLLH